MSDETPFKFDFSKLDFNKLGVTDYDAILQGSHIRLESGHDVKVLVVTDNDACREAGVPETQGICLLYKSEVRNRQHCPFPIRKNLGEIR